MKGWLNRRPPHWVTPKDLPSWTISDIYEAGADVMFEAMMMERPTEEEWRLRMVDIQFGELSVPEFLEWLRAKNLVNEHEKRKGIAAGR